MIRLNQRVQLMEWGEGTSTLNQNWQKLAEGIIRQAKQEFRTTTLSIEIDGVPAKKNPRDNAIKVAQKGEGMTARSDAWGEVAIGTLKSIETRGAKSLVQIEIVTAQKCSTS